MLFKQKAPKFGPRCPLRFPTRWSHNGPHKNMHPVGLALSAPSRASSTGREPPDGCALMVGKELCCDPKSLPYDFFTLKRITSKSQKVVLESEGTEHKCAPNLHRHKNRLQKHNSFLGRVESAPSYMSDAPLSYHPARKLTVKWFKRKKIKGNPIPDKATTSIRLRATLLWA